MDPPRVHSGDVEMGHQATVQPASPHERPAMAMNQQHHGGQGHITWDGNNANTLLVVATLITTLTYQIGTNLPGGYWQETRMEDGRLFLAGDPIMRDLHVARYIVFMVASWIGLVGSMLMTLSLLMGMAVDSRHVRWPFAVAYSSLILTFILTGNRTLLPVDIVIWLAVLCVLGLIISYRPEHRTRILQVLRCRRMMQ